MRARDNNVREIVPGLLLGGLGQLRRLLSHSPDVLLPLDSVPGWVWEDGFRGEILYYPIPDYGTLPDDVLERLVEQALSRLEEGKRIAVFCAGGRGRTGYVAACLLRRLGQENPIALLHREYDPGAVESEEQYEAVLRYCQRHEAVNRRGNRQVLRTVRVARPAELVEDPEVLRLFGQLSEELSPGGRFLLRRSGVLPEIRLLAEAPTLSACEGCIERFLDLLWERGYLGQG